jgi:hypothetical protein
LSTIAYQLILIMFARSLDTLNKRRAASSASASAFFRVGQTRKCFV